MVRWVIVAHPDDEVIFAGGAILSHREEPWTVVIATHDQDSARAAESLVARDQFRALGVRVDYRFLGFADDPYRSDGGIDRASLAGQLERLGVQARDRVYTHGSPGEYGHNGHKSIHAGVAGSLADTAEVTAFSGAGEVVERIIDSSLLAEKARVFNAAYPSQVGVWKGLARTMIAVTSEETHHALSVLDPAAAETANPLRRLDPVPRGSPDLGALALEVNTQIAGLPRTKGDALVIGVGPGVDLDFLRSRYAGRIDLLPPFESPPPAGARVEAIPVDFARWQPNGRTYDLLVCVGVLPRRQDFATVFELAGRVLRAGGQLILSHELLIQGHPDYGRAYFMTDVPYYRGTTQAVVELSRRNGMKIRVLKELVAGKRLGQPIIHQLVRLERR